MSEMEDDELYYTRKYHNDKIKNNKQDCRNSTCKKLYSPQSYCRHCVFNMRNDINKPINQTYKNKKGGELNIMTDELKDLDPKKFLKAVMDIKNNFNTNYIFANEVKEKFKDIINKLEEYEQLDDLLNNTTVKELIHIIHEYRTGGKHEEN